MNNTQHVNCNLCGVDDTSLITIQNNYRVVKCKNCGLVYVNPRPSQKTLIGLYNDYHQRDGKDESTWEILMARNFKEVSALLNRIFPEKGVFLDIGCGYGHFLEYMNRYGWATLGIDPSSQTIAHAKARGLNVEENTIDGISLSRGPFDAITAFYVLEHLFDPFGSLQKMFMMLKPGGVLVLRVPHTTPLVKALSLFKIRNSLYDVPFHLYDFSPKTLKLLLEKAGFADIKIVPGRPTIPDRLGEKITSVVSGMASQILFSLSRGTILIPGTSKTVIATKSLTTDMESK